ncbi:MAG: hypothetical protein WC558_08400 [Patulibacter sp.]
MPGKAAPALASLFVVLATTLAIPALATAHGGLLLGGAEAGPYRVQLMGLAVTRGVDGPAIDYTAYVQRTDDGRPVEDADVRIVVELEDGDRALRVQRIGNGYEGIARVPSSHDVQAYPVRVAVRGPEGTSDLRVTPPAGSGPPAALLGGTAVALLLMGGLVVRARRRGPGISDAETGDPRPHQARSARAVEVRHPDPPTNGTRR